MNRRDTLKAIGLGTLSTGLLLGGCKPGEKETAATTETSTAAVPGRMPEEVEREKKISAEKYFDEHEMATITVLANIIIPKDAKSGSASDAKVPEFIEFIVKDIPSHKLPMRGGLRWLDMQCLNRYGKTFVKCSSQEQIHLIDLIAYPELAKVEVAQGVAFFNRMRDLTASGFWSSEMGTKDIGYAGNAPNKWEGVPLDVLKQYGMENVKV
jgi:gluconate 2-dehydrogenase gamma chain